MENLVSMDFDFMDYIFLIDNSNFSILYLFGYKKESISRIYSL